MECPLDKYKDWRRFVVKCHNFLLGDELKELTEQVAKRIIDANIVV